MFPNNINPKRACRLKEANWEDGYPDKDLPGVGILDNGYLIFACPGCGKIGPCRVGEHKPSTTPSWLMTGIFPNLTLKPSINCVACCGWHGYLTDGEFKPC